MARASSFPRVTGRWRVGSEGTERWRSRMIAEARQRLKTIREHVAPRGEGLGEH
jgi:hypothetical protein